MEQSRPFISVIIPTYERAGQLYVCLGALAAQDYPRDCFEVVVVDDGSSSSPDSSVETFRHQLDVRLLKQLHSGPAAARNYGAAQAKGAFLAFTDDDCTPAVGWLQSLATYFVSCGSNCAIGGRTINGLANNPYSAVSQLVVDYLYTKWNHHPVHVTFFTSNNLALPVQSFHAVGGFDVGWTRAAGEDRDLCDRLVAHGCRLIYAPEALVRHAHFLTFRTFWEQHFNYGRGAYRVHQSRARRDARSIRIESLMFYLSMIGYPFVRAPYRRAVVLAALIGVAQLATAAGFFLERTTQGRHL